MESYGIFGRRDPSRTRSQENRSRMQERRPIGLLPSSTAKDIMRRGGQELSNIVIRWVKIVMQVWNFLFTEVQ